jgi:peptide/nickel transport system substrate-binding protein
MRKTWWRHVGVVAVLALVAAACGGDDEGGGGDGEQPAPADVTIIHGTTDSIVSLDPAGSYDLGSWQIINNVMEGLLTIPAGGNEPEPALAESCDFDDPQTYTCTLKQDVTFHDGSPFTAEDVVFSLERNINLDDPNGACSLLGALAPCAKWDAESVEAVDDYTVTFHLAAPDATWPFILTTPAAYVVPSETYPADALQPDDQMVGTGPYSMAEFRAGEQIVLEANPDFHGEAPLNQRVIVTYFDRSSALKLAIEQGEVDVAWRTMTPTDISDLEGAEGVEVLTGPGAEIRYLVFNLDFEPGSELAVRQAVAQTIDRQAIAENVYNGTVEPLYSMVPTTYAGHTDDFAEMYGETPDPEAAAQTLADAGIETPVELEIWWTPTHYGDLSADEYAEIKRSLEDSGLFSVTLESTEWDQYSEAAFTDQYPVYQLGWFPDYLDADNYVTSFYSSESFLNVHYENKEVDDLLAQQKASTDQAEREQIFEQIQQIAAEDVPIIPVWQGSQVAVVRDGVSGVEETLDAAYIFRYWLVGKSA